MDETRQNKEIDWLRNVRDGQAAALAGKSEDEVIAYFRRAAEAAREYARRDGRRRPVIDTR